MKRQTKLNVALAAAGFALAASSASAATTLIDEDFQLPVVANGTDVNGILPGWTVNANRVKFRTTTSAIPEDDDVTGTNQVAQIENNGTAFRYVTTHNWAVTDVLTLSLNASPQAWNLPEQRYVRPTLRQVSDDTIIWDPGENMTGANKTAMPTATGLSWNGPGLHGDPGGLNGNTWQNTASETLFTFTIDASTFGAGSAGEAIYLDIDGSGFRGFHIDNVVLTLTDPVPEPSSTALLGLGGLALILRRRK
jgi:hypothetical protein